MGLRRYIGGVAVLAVSIPTIASAAVAILATTPRLAAKVFGATNPAKTPSAVGLAATDVAYAPGCPAWWIPAASPVAAVVIVHGFEPSEDPRATDPGPRLELAAMLAGAGFSSLVVSLGYGTGAHPHTGGALEANDIAAAVRWVEAESGQPVAVVGFSAGGHAAVAAASDCDIFALVTDSSFVNFAEVAANQGADLLNVPAWLFAMAPRFMALITGHHPIDLEKTQPVIAIPTLHVHGDADEAIAHSNLGRIAAVTGGEMLTIAGADHIESLHTDPATYRAAVIGFLKRALAHSALPD